MKIALILIAFILAIIGWFKRDRVSIYITIIVVVLLLLVAAFQIIIEFKDVKDKEKIKQSGILESKTKILLSSEKNIYPKLELGDGGTIFSWEGPEGEPMLKILKDSHITIFFEDGELKVSSIIRDRNGVIAELVRNEWKVNHDNSYDRNYSRNAFEVKNNNGEIVLQVKHVGDRIQFQGKFYDSHGNGVAFGKHPSGKGGTVEKTGSNHPELNFKIDPIFKYHSDFHLGELIE